MLCERTSLHSSSRRAVFAMESNQVQVNDLHKKFEELNEEISAALRVQQDAVAGASTFGDRSNLAAARKDALRLGKKTSEWRGDVTALAKHIDVQLQHSRALRSHYAQSLLSTTAQRQQEEAEGSRLRCLRSDLRLLQDFRVNYVHQNGEKDSALQSAIEEETVRCPSWPCETNSSMSLTVVFVSLETTQGLPRQKLQEGEDGRQTGAISSSPGAL